MSLVKHAKKELKLAGLMSKGSDYDGMLGKAVIELIEAFSKQGHSGYSASQTIQLFVRLAQYQNITPIGSTPDEWQEVSVENGKTLLWQNTRRSSTFSRDGGKTWYDIDDPHLNNGDTWKPKWWKRWL